MCLSHCACGTGNFQKFDSIIAPVSFPVLIVFLNRVLG
jgi:hypothetical protein